MSKERYPKDFPDLPSVTQVIDAFPSPHLVNWFKTHPFQEQKAITDKGKEIGKTLHELRIRIEKGEPFDITTKYPEEVQNCLKSYFLWRKERNISEILHSEVKMYNRTLGFKGTCDDITVRNFESILLEYKTSNGIYDDAREQIIAYSKLLTHSDTKYDGNPPNRGGGYFAINEKWIIRFGKEKAEYEAIQVLDSEMDELFESFQHKLAIYNIRKKREIKNRDNYITRQNKIGGRNKPGFLHSRINEGSAFIGEKSNRLPGGF